MYALLCCWFCCQYCKYASFHFFQLNSLLSDRFQPSPFILHNRIQLLFFRLSSNVSPFLCDDWNRQKGKTSHNQNSCTNMEYTYDIYPTKIYECSSYEQENIIYHKAIFFVFRYYVYSFWFPWLLWTWECVCMFIP